MTTETIADITEIERLQRINKVLMERVENDTNRQGNAFSLFQTALNLEAQVRRRTNELTATLTRLEGINQELASAKEMAEFADRSKTRFLAAASHDLLQPLNAALLSLSLLGDEQTTDEGRRIVGQIEHSMINIEELLRTLLDISKFDAGVMKPSMSAVPLDQLIASLIDDFRPLADTKGLQLRSRTTPIRIRTDKTIMRRILQNLISNAIRYTPDGGVLVGIRDYKTSIVVDVIDTGCGISDEDQGVIFEEFNRGSARAIIGREDQQGFGLGLSIVKRMVDALGYRLEVSSTVGSGSRFRLLINEANKPAMVLEEPEKTELSYKTASLKNKKVMLIENDHAVRNAMRKLLDSWQTEVKSATALDDTLAIVLDKNWVPDIIVADQHLDSDNLGTSAVATVRALANRKIPAIIATADPSEELELQVRKMGVELMHKPVKPAHLRALMSHLLSVS